MESTKKLVFVINVDWYFKLHWVERASYFRSKGYEVHIITKFTDNESLRYFSSLGFVCHSLRFARKSINPFSEISSIFSLYHEIKKIQPTLVHCVTVKPNLYCGILNRLFLKRPIIFSVTGLGIIFSSNHFKFRMIRRLVTLLYRFVSTPKSYFIFENSDDYKCFIDKKVVKNNGTVIKGAGIDLNKFSPSPFPNNQSVLFAARLLKEKGLDQLIEARKILKKEGVDFTIKVAGIVDTDVSSAISLNQIEQWSSEGLIEWLGSVINMPALIAESDIVCLPTVYGEGVPRILIEAASCERAIVATDVVGCREIVSNHVNGILCKPNDSESLASALKYLLAEPVQTKAFGINGRKLVEEQFSQHIVFGKTEAVYLKIS
ncbi:glycosyltransferase family 4 protein [Vibrio hangzhouensis]|uniref:Glycosyltransferase involved in cell wall bisynthesis n=1 Tax=Vibrio hangzhouensis TaxID=462991 RepID=A0A1H6C0V0_9VIBR|nr:glycosyltransferase family 4 protein [Vibrio hangzhouensis]SEG66285.1 Glycosyltransferase involved in cell wall bisynthesis [Vibrio hangzhouensis]